MLILNNPASVRSWVIGLPLLSPHLSPFADRITGYYPSGSFRISLGLQMAKTHKHMVCVCGCVCWSLCLNTDCHSTAVSFQLIIIFYHYCFLWGCFNISTAYALICSTNSPRLLSSESLSRAEKALQWMDSQSAYKRRRRTCFWQVGVTVLARFTKTSGLMSWLPEDRTSSSLSGHQELPIPQMHN